VESESPLLPRIPNSEKFVTGQLKNNTIPSTLYSNVKFVQTPTYYHIVHNGLLGAESFWKS
jgi:hypothetical protein